MRIVIDMQGAQTESRLRGIGRYSMAFAKALVRNPGAHEIILALSGLFPDTIEPIRTTFESLIPQENIRVWSAPGPCPALNPAATSLRRQTEIIREAFLAELVPDWVVVSSLFEGLNSDACVTIGRLHNLPTAVIQYDLIPWIYPDIYLRDPRFASWYRYQLDQLRRADALLAISASSGCEVVDYLGFEPEQVFDILSAADSRFAPKDVTAADRKSLAKRYSLERPFIMYTGGIDPRKNIEGLIRAYSLLPVSIRKKHHLAIVCGVSDPERAKLLALAQDEGLKKDEIILTGFVPENDLLNLYNTCQLFVFPSWHEGFGLPLLEAMQCGRPVLASNRSSLPEVVGRKDALFDPFDLKDMADKIELALTDASFRQSLADHGLEQSKKFSWNETAQRALAVLEQPIPNRLKEVFAINNYRPNLAYISPLPPERSGIAYYSSELLRDLTRHYHIDVVVQDLAAPNNAYIYDTCDVVSVEKFRRNASKYDRILYHFGNSEFHEHMFHLIEEWPGVVVLHDFFLSSIQQLSEIHKWRPHCWTRALQASHGYPAVVDRFKEIDTAKVVYLYPANLPVLQASLGVIVHSKFNRSLAETWYGEGTANDWAVIPLLRLPEIQIDRTGARKRLGIPKDTFLVCSFGILGPTKLNHRLIEAWLASSLSQSEDAHLVFVGQASKEYGKHLLNRIKKSNAKNIKIIGWADEISYRDWLAATDIAVQLRTFSRGETSGTVLDCMNFGLATIANSNGSQAELDPDTIWHLPDEFTDAELIEALETLAQDLARRSALGQRARKVIRERHNPRRCAEQYSQAIERFYQRAEQGLHGAQKYFINPSNLNLLTLARVLAHNHPSKPRRRQLFVDISGLVQQGLMTKSQPNMKAILEKLLKSIFNTFSFEPVYFRNDQLGYFYARKFTCHFLDIPDQWAEDEPIDYWPGDVLFLLDSEPQVQLKQRSFYQVLRREGVLIKIGDPKNLTNFISSM